MNGEERALISGGTQDSPLEAKQYIALSHQEKQDLVVLAANPVFKTLCKVMENEMILAMVEACEVDPADEKKQRAMMGIAHSYRKFYQKIRQAVDFERNEAFAEVKLRAAKAMQEDADFVENVILNHQ